MYDQEQIEKIIVGCLEQKKRQIAQKETLEHFSSVLVTEKHFAN